MTRRSSSLKRWGLAAAVSALLLGGCTNGEASSSDDYALGDAAGALEFAEARGYDDVVAILEDGSVTKEEYGAAHEALRACMEDLGFAYGPPILDPIGGLQLMEEGDYRGPGESPSDADVEECQGRYFFPVEVVYFASNVKKMEPSLVAAVHLCLDREGVPYSGDETNFQSFYPEGETWGPNDPVAKCVSAEAMKLYPDLPVVGLGF